MKKRVLAAVLAGLLSFLPAGARGEESKLIAAASAGVEMQSSGLTIGTEVLKRETVYSEVVVPIKESVKSKSITKEEFVNEFAALVSFYEGDEQAYWRSYQDASPLELFVTFYDAELNANYAYRLREGFEWDKFPEEEAWSALGDVLRAKSEWYRKAEIGVKKVQNAATIEARDRKSGFSAKLRPSIRDIQNENGTGIGATLFFDKFPFINDLKIKYYKGNVRAYTSLKKGWLKDHLSKVLGNSCSIGLEYEWKDLSYDDSGESRDYRYANTVWLCFKKKF